MAPLTRAIGTPRVWRHGFSALSAPDDPAPALQPRLNLPEGLLA